MEPTDKSSYGHRGRKKIDRKRWYGRKFLRFIFILVRADMRPYVWYYAILLHLVICEARERSYNMKWNDMIWYVWVKTDSWKIQLGEQHALVLYVQLGSWISFFLDSSRAHASHRTTKSAFIHDLYLYNDMRVCVTEDAVVKNKSSHSRSNRGISWPRRWNDTKRTKTPE